MKVLVLEDEESRIQYFVRKWNTYDLHLTCNAFYAISLLKESIFNLIFLDNDLGEGNGSGVHVARFLYEHKNNKNNNARIIVHSWNMPAVAIIRGLLPRVLCFPYGVNDFFDFDIDK